MKLPTNQLTRKVNRLLEQGRVSHNRVHKSKKQYNRKKLGKVKIAFPFFNPHHPKHRPLHRIQGIAKLE